MKKILLTGATGFIGRQCLPLLLDRSFEVHAVTPDNHLGIADNVQWHTIDLTEKIERKNLIKKIRPTHLLHLAWYVAPGKWASAKENYDWVIISLDLVKNFREFGGERCVLAGSGMEYDWNYGYCSEDITPTNSSTFYGQCKNSLSSLVAGYSDITGLSSAWGRIFFLYGPHENPARLVASVIKSLLMKEPALCSHGKQIRDYLYSKDVADALVTILESNFEGEVNIGSGNPVELRYLINKIGKKLKSENLIKLGAIPPAPTDKPFVSANVNRLFNKIGWNPKYSLDEGIDETIKWWKENIKETV